MRGFDLLTVDKWFGGGMLDLPPRDGVFLELKAGQVSTFELSCNRGFTTYAHPSGADKPKPEYACPGKGALHNMNEYGTPYNQLNLTKFGGTAIGIAYTDDIHAVKPKDFSMISVNYTSPWYRLTDYAIPRDLPACPPKGCLCTWNWIHTKLNGEGYGDEFVGNL